jgi:hypothetical protein
VDQAGDGHVTLRRLAPEADNEMMDLERERRLLALAGVALGSAGSAWRATTQTRRPLRVKSRRPSITLSTGPKSRARTHQPGASNFGCRRESSHRPDSSAL